MKVLFLAPQPPCPPDQGAKLRNYHLIRIAAEAGHAVDVLAFGGEDEPRAGPHPPAPSPARGGVGGGVRPGIRSLDLVPPLPPRPAPARLRDMLLTRRPDLMLRLWSPGYLAALQRRLAEERYDVVQVEGLELAGYLPAIRGPAVVFDDHNVEALLQERAFRTDVRRPRRAHAALYSFIQWRKLRRWEAQVCRRADAVLAVSEADAAALGALSGRDVAAVPNGIDLSAIPYRPPVGQPRPDLLFDGTMSFRPNDDAATWFCRDVLPRVRAERPEARFWVVGRGPSAALVAYNFGPNGVAVTGEVESVEPYWKRASVYVLPMRMGGGVRFKALEAMARGVPLVSTALGVEGTGALPDHDYLRAERPDELAAAVLRLLDDLPLRARLAESARRTVAAHDWTRIGPRLLAVYEGLGSP